MRFWKPTHARVHLVYNPLLEEIMRQKLQGQKLYSMTANSAYSCFASGLCLFTKFRHRNQCQPRGHWVTQVNLGQLLPTHATSGEQRGPRCCMFLITRDCCTTQCILTDVRWHICLQLGNLWSPLSPRGDTQSKVSLLQRHKTITNHHLGCPEVWH